MKSSVTTSRRVKILGCVFLLAASGHVLGADAPAAEKAEAPKGPSPAKVAINVHKAAFTLIANNFKPIGDAAQGKGPYEAADIAKRAKRVAFLSEFLDGTFPEAANVGEPDTKAKPELWTKKADFDQKLKDFQLHAATLATVASKETTASEAFKTAANAVAQDCKSCHDAYKLK